MPGTGYQVTMHQRSALWSRSPFGGCTRCPLQSWPCGGPCTQRSRNHVATRLQLRCSAQQHDGTGPSSSGSTASPAPQKRAEVAANVERAAVLISEIVDEVTKELFLSEAVAFLQDDQADQTETLAIKSAVLKRVEFLDANFLTALSGFIRAAGGAQDEQLAQLLLSIRDEVLGQVSMRLPTAARALDLALREADKEARVALLRKVLSGGEGDVPGVEMDSLAATASQFIDEMEEQSVVLDRQLLARLCLVREELRFLREEQAFSDPAASHEFVRANVPQRCAAFLKELVAVRDPLARLGLLDKAFREDWEGAAPRGPAAGVDASPYKDQPDFVRPGRFLATLTSTVRHLSELDAAANAAVVARLEQIRGEALVVLDRMQSGAVAAVGSPA